MEDEKKPVTQPEEKTEVPVTQTDEKTEGKTFTQEEVNAMVIKAENKINKKYENIDLEAYNKWQESQKTEAEKQTELTQKLTNTNNENISLKQENQVLKCGVNVDDVDYVVFKVSKMEGEFEDNLKEFLEKNPKYLENNKKQANTSTTTGFDQNSTSNPVSDEKAYKDKKYAKNPYYKK